MATVVDARFLRRDLIKITGILMLLCVFLATYFFHLRPDPPSPAQIQQTLDGWFQTAASTSTCARMAAAIQSDASCGPSGASCRARLARLKGAFNDVCKASDAKYAACVTVDTLKCLAKGSSCTKFLDSTNACFQQAVDSSLRTKDPTLDDDIQNAGKDELS